MKNEIFKKKLHNGLMIYLTPEDHIQRTLLWYGFYEKNSILAWEALIKKDSIVVDIGANTGYYTLIAAHKAAGGWVHSFEPISASYQALEQNLVLNNISNVIICKVGISDNESIQAYYVSSSDNIGMSGMKCPENFSGSIEYVKTITLDNYAAENKLDQINIIKIDIEGNELNALKGMRTILSTYRPILFIEIIKKHLGNFDTGIDDVYTFLNSYGYKPFKITGPNTLEPIGEPQEGKIIIFKYMN